METGAYLPNGSFHGELNETSENDEGCLVFLCDDAPPSVAVATAASFITIFCMAVSGNVLLLYTLARFEDLRNVTNLLVLNVAVSDLLFAATLPFWSTDHLSHWLFGSALCRILIGFYFLGLFCGLMFLTALTVNRYVAVVYGRATRPGRRLARTRAACVAVWLLGALGATWEMVSTVTVEVEPDLFACEAVALGTRGERTASYLQVGLLFLLPLAVVLFCYARILRVTMSRVSGTRHRTVTVVLCIVAAFFVCWGPYNVLLLLRAGYGTECWDCEASARMHLAVVTCRILAYAHCCINPILYAFTSTFRAHLAEIFSCCLLGNGATNEREGAGPTTGPAITHNIPNSCTEEGDVSAVTPHITPAMELKSIA